MKTSEFLCTRITIREYKNQLVFYFTIPYRSCIEVNLVYMVSILSRKRNGAWEMRILAKPTIHILRKKPIRIIALRKMLSGFFERFMCDELICTHVA